MTATASTGPGLGPGRPDGGAALTFTGVDMVFGDGTHALDGVDLSVRPGELVTIVGPSGCGKSTVLKIASGLLTSTGGTVEIPDPNVGYVFQDATLLPWRSVRRNVELFAELHGVDRAERARRADDAIALVGLDGFEDHLPRRLSGGMRMRVSLARSLVLDPTLFMFDEPFGALDEIARERLQEELLRLFVANRFAGLFITHSLYEAVFLSTRVLVMSPRPGRIVAEIDVPFDHPRDRDTRFDPSFARIAGEVSAALRDGEPG